MSHLKIELCNVLGVCWLSVFSPEFLEQFMDKTFRYTRRVCTEVLGMCIGIGSSSSETVLF